MIEPELARRFIEQVTQYTEYNINIMDESGVIIASRDPKRVGTYHEVADRIIRGTQDMIVIRDEKMFPGVLPGINMAIIHDGRKEGVVGVTGDPDKIRDVALITRMAMEAMLRYEKQQEEIRLRRSRKEHFISLLTQMEFASAAEIRGIARQLEYDESRIRVPILCRMFRGKISPGAQKTAPARGTEAVRDINRDRDPDAVRGSGGPTDSYNREGSLPDPEEVLEVLRRGRGHWRQDFSYVMDETHLLVFKTVRVDGRRNMVDYREEIGEYLENILKWLKDRGVRASFYVGTLQNSFSQYYYAYRHCKWLESHVQNPGDIVYFTDYVKEYFRTLTPRQELHRIFNVYDSETPDEKKQQFVEMIRALEETNYNLSETAGKLYIHKNTLIYRYNRMKDYLGVDPLLNMEGREFLGLLLMYLAQKR